MNIYPIYACEYIYCMCLRSKIVLSINDSANMDFFPEAHDVGGNHILLSLSMINTFDLFDSLNGYRILEYNAYRLTKIEYTDAFHNVRRFK